MTVPTAHDSRSEGRAATGSRTENAARDAASQASVGLHCERVGFDRYEIRKGDDTIGHIEVVGPVYVVLAGRRYDRAVEIRQTLDFDDALRALDHEARNHRATRQAATSP